MEKSFIYIQIIFLLYSFSGITGQNWTILTYNTANDIRCSSSPSACLFNDSTLWLPPMVPNNNSSIIIKSYQFITITILSSSLPYVYSIASLSMWGNAVLNISFPISIGEYSGGSSGANVQLFDNSSLLILPSTFPSGVNSLSMYNNSFIYVHGGQFSVYSSFYSSPTCYIIMDGGYLYMGPPMDAMVSQFYSLSLSGGATASFFYGVEINYLNISGESKISSKTTVLNEGYISDNSYIIEGLFTYGEAEVWIQNVYYFSLIHVANYSTLYFINDGCNITELLCDYPAQVNFIGDGNFTLWAKRSIYSSYPGYLHFISSSYDITNYVSIMGDGSLNFTGNYVVNVNDFSLWNLTMDGHVTFNALFWMFISSYYTKLPPANFTIVMNDIFFDYYDYYTNDTRFLWPPGGVVEIGYGSSLISSSNVSLSNEQCIYFIQDSLLSSPSLTIGDGTRIWFLDDAQTNIISDVVVDGIFDLFDPDEYFLDFSAPSTNVTINGSLTITKNGIINIPQTIKWDRSYPSGIGFIYVSGTANLGGTLNISLGGDLLTNQPNELDIPILVASEINGDFDTFKGNFVPPLSQNTLALSYKIIGNAVTIHIRKKLIYEIVIN